MAHDAATRLKARNLYVYQKLSIKEVSDTIGCCGPTVSRWKIKAADAGDDWEKARVASGVAGQGFTETVWTLIEDYTYLHQRAMADLKGSEDMPVKERAETMVKLADSFTKTMAAAGKASPQVNKLAVAQDVIQLFGKFVTENYPEHGPAFVEILEPFIKEVGRTYA